MQNLSPTRPEESETLDLRPEIWVSSSQEFQMCVVLQNEDQP